MGAGTWAKSKGKPAPSASPSGSASGSGSAPSATGAMTAVSSANDDGYDDDKFHLPVDHQPFVLLPGWDKTPAPPPAPAPPPGASGSGSASGGSTSGGSDSKAALPMAPPPPPPPGFSCQDCAFFKAHGNGRFGCENEDFQRWAGTDQLSETKTGRPVMNPMMASSDWFKPAVGAGAHPVPTRHNGR